MIGRRRVPVPPEPSGGPSARGTEADFAALLGHFGAVRFAMPSGYWCYLLIGADGLPFYPGITGNLLRRLGEHRHAWGNRIADVKVIKTGSEHEARVLQFLFADRFDHCIEGFLGTAAYEKYRAELHRAARDMDLPAHVTAGRERAAAAHRQEAAS